jgi:hypothetical protein
VLALVPCSADSWPTALLKRMALVMWDRPTTARAVRRSISRLARRGTP